MAAARIVEAIDIFEDRHFRLSACLPRPSPDQLSFDRFEDRLNRSVVIRRRVGHTKLSLRDLVTTTSVELMRHLQHPE